MIYIGSTATRRAVMAINVIGVLLTYVRKIMNSLFKNRSIAHKDTMMAVLALTLLASAGAMAGADTTFSAASAFLDSSLTGSLGKTFALGSLAVGLGVGIVKQSVIAVAIGIGMALCSSLGPSILTGMFTATI
jgi:conjugal transfer pilus assembly protein TraA